MTDRKPFAQEIMNEALNDPNLTNEERAMIDQMLMIALKEPPMIGLMAPLESGHMGSRRRLKNSVFHLLSQV
jgi:hypothetical protein